MAAADAFAAGVVSLCELPRLAVALGVTAGSLVLPGLLVLKGVVGGRPEGCEGAPAIQELPQLAQINQSSVKAIGVTLKLDIMDSAAYYGGSQTGSPKGWGSTPWLNAPINITGWGFRPVPDVYLTSALGTKGIWNAAHYSNAHFDRIVKSYIAAISLKDQRKYARQLETILLHDTPVIFPFFYDALAAGSTHVQGYKADALGPIYLSKTSIA